jgi:ribosomal protein S18 acetylase RimI-like enzyme
MGLEEDLLEVVSMHPLVEPMIRNIRGQFSRLCAGVPGMQVVTEPDWFGILSTHPDQLYNELDGTCFPGDQADTKIRKVLSRYANLGHLPMEWVVTPTCQPKNLTKVLLAHGFKHCTTWPGMFLKLDKPAGKGEPGNGLKISQVSNPDQLRQWLVPLQESFQCSGSLTKALFEGFQKMGLDGRLPWKLLLGMVDGESVAISRLYYLDGLAGIWDVVTRPCARGKGYGTEMTGAAVTAAKEMGYETAILFATKSGHGVYRRLGFQECFSLEVYLSPEIVGWNSTARVDSAV